MIKDQSVIDESPSWMYYRKTKETEIAMTLSQLKLSPASINGAPEGGYFNVSGTCEGKTGIGFFDHMLTAFCHYSGLNLSFELIGDFEVDQHHSLEDFGYALGTCFKNLLDASSDLQRQRFAHCYVPMDESLVRVVVDLSGRPYLKYNVLPLRDFIGQLESDCLLEFFRAFIQNAKITCHIDVLEGVNSHHMVEGIFKALALSLKNALMVQNEGFGPNSTKGLID